MLGDRDYMRRGDPDYRDYYDKAGFYSVFILIAVNVLLFLPQTFDPKVLPMGVCNVGAFKNGDVLSLVTSLFAHGNFGHILFNMYSLWLFGIIAAPKIGVTKFILLYLVSGVVGNLVWIAFNYDYPGLTVLGASGAIAGVTFAAAMVAPRMKFIMLFFPKPMQLKTLAIVFIAINFFSQFLFGATSETAYIAHIGGFAGGYLFMVIFCRRNIVWEPISQLIKSKLKSTSSNRNVPPSWSYRPPENTSSSSGPYKFQGTQDTPVSQRELDSLLDKISRSGINSLSENELVRLRKAREQIRSNDNKR